MSFTVVHQGPIDASPPPRADTERIRIVLARSLTAFAALLAWFVLYALVLSSFEQNHAQHALYDRLRRELAEGTAPTGAPIDPGAPLALLDIPSVDVDKLVVVEGTRAQQLQSGPGHVQGSALPGQSGVSVVAGRSLSFGGPFADLADIRVGAQIVATTGQGTFTYVVGGARRDGDPRPPTPAAGEGRLTLVTAGRTGGFLSRLQPTETVYIDADLVTDAVAAGPQSVRDTDAPFLEVHADRGTLALLVLALQFLAAVLVGIVWSWQRWSRAATWLTGIPVLVAALWLASSIGTRLLPALI